MTVDPSILPPTGPSVRPVHDALREWLSEVEMRFTPTLPSFLRDRYQTACGREQTVSQFLEANLPTGWSVKKGPIYDIQGGVSAEVDCAICIPEHPPCRTPNRDVILAEGVYAAVEVKPDISSFGDEGEFVRGLKQAVSVKRLSRQITFAYGRTPAWPNEAHRIPYVIFADKMRDLRPCAEFIDKQKEANGWSPWDLPDIVLGYHQGLIYHAAQASVASIAPFLGQHGLSAGEGYLLFPAGADTLILFLALLYSFATPQPQISAPILQSYLLPLAIPAGTELLRVTTEL